MLVYVTVIFYVLSATTLAQWGVPLANTGYNSMWAGNRIQPMNQGVYYGPTQGQLWNNEVAAQLAPQFAYFGYEYARDGGPDMPARANNYFSIPPSTSGIQPPLTMRASPDQRYNPAGVITSQQVVQTPQYGQFNYAGSLPITRLGYDNFQANDDFVGTIEKPASLPPTSEPTRVLPPFLKDQSKEVQDKFYAIVQHPALSAREKNEQIEDLVRSLSTEVQNTFAQYQQAASSELAAKRQRVHEAVAAMSPEAQQLFQKFSALMTSPRLREEERLEKIQDLYSKTPGEIKQEFDSKFTNL